MFADPVSFSGDTRVEVITVLANCGRDTDRARRALVTWIRRKQNKGRTTEHILAKLRNIESKFIMDTTLHSAFRDARAETCLPRAPDLPLPSFVERKAQGQIPESVPSITTRYSTWRDSVSSSSVELPANASRSPTSRSYLSRDSFQMSEIFSGKSNTSQRTSLPQGVPRVSQSHIPPIQIPRDRSRPAPNSPITSSPEESLLHFRNRYMSQPVGSSTQSNGPVTPISASPPGFPLSSITSLDQNLDTRRRLSHNLASPPPSARIQISRSRSQRSAPTTLSTSSSDESDIHSRRYRPMSQPIGSASPTRHRVTPPRTSPPHAPLPSIPADDQSAESDSNNSEKNLPAEQPPTPLQSATLNSFAPVRPLPIQPIPSPVPGSDESEHADTISGYSLQQNWQASNGDLPSDIIVRQDSPVYVFHDDHAGPNGIRPPPPPYVEQLDTYSPPDMPTIGDSLDRLVNKCGGSPEVRLVVSKCVEFHCGYEPPYWQSRLQACGLDAETAKHFVDEMSRQVDWATSFRRSA